MTDPCKPLKCEDNIVPRLKSLVRWLMLFGMLVMAAPAQQCTGDEAVERKVLMKFELTSTAFEEGGTIPAKFTCAGEDVSPFLEWSHAPEGTRSFALICDDPDAPMGTWVHWVLYGIPAGTTSLAEGIPDEKSIEGVGRQGKNDFKRIGYGGPCPPPGKAHRYFFKLYALDQEPDLEPGATKKDLERAMKGHILAEGRIMGTFRR